MHSFATLFSLLASYFISSPLRDAAGISLGTDMLPKLFVATLIASVIVSPLTSSFLAGKEGSIRQFYALNGMILVAFYFLFLVSSMESDSHFHRSIQIIFYVFLSVENLVVISALWSRAADTFTTEQSRRLFGFISAAATLGQLAGSLITIHVSKVRQKSSQPLYGLVFLSAIFMFVAAFFSSKIQRVQGKNTQRQNDIHGQMDPKQQISVSQLFQSLMLISKSSYLLSLCLYLTMTYVVGSLMYFQRSLIIASSIKDSNERTQFFAQVYSLSALAVIILQICATGRLLSLLGITFALSCFPLSCACLIGGISNFPSTITLACAEVVRKILGYVLVRPAREVLFTAVSREEKYHCKILIDSVLQRLGDSLAALVFQILDVNLRLGQEGVAVAGVMSSLVWFIGSLSLGRQYFWLTTTHAYDQTSLQLLGLTTSCSQDESLESAPLQLCPMAIHGPISTVGITIPSGSPTRRATDGTIDQ